jgi:hypothetical protein
MGAPHPRRGQFWRELLKLRATHRWGSFSWLSLSTLLQSGNDRIARFDASIVNSRRMRWVEAQRDRKIDPHARVELRDATTMVVLGDPGEMDASQYVLVRDLMATEPDVLLLMSDIVYPAGNVNAWRDAVYLPYLGLPASAWTEACAKWRAAFDPGEVSDPKVPAWQVFATPGNHDWYDGLTGFMFNACGAEPLPAVTFSTAGLSFAQRTTRRLWQNPAVPDRDMLQPLRVAAAQRWKPAKAPGPMPWQPGPYFALDLGRAGPSAALRIVCVDTGIDGSIDVGQALWLQDVLDGDVPKVVVTGKPLVTGNAVHDMPIDGGPVPRPEGRPSQEPPPATLRALIADGERVIATLAGDIHNSQRIVLAGDAEPSQGPGGSTRCVVRLDAAAFERASAFAIPPVQIVAGGGGAYLSETHTTTLEPGGGLPLDGGGHIPRNPIAPGLHTRYPSRAQSVALLATRAGRIAGTAAALLGLLVLGAAVALAHLAHRAAARTPSTGPSDPDARTAVPSDVCVSGACLDQVYVLLAPVAVLALAAGSALLVTAVRRWWRSATDRSGLAQRPPAWQWVAGLVLAALAAGLLRLGHDVPFGDAGPVFGGVAVALAAPLLPVIIPLVQSFPALGRLLPLRAIAVAAVGLGAAAITEVEISLATLLPLLIAAVLLFLAIGRLVELLVRLNDRWATDGRHPYLRAFIALLSLWPLGLIVLAILALPQGREAEWQNVKEPATIIVLVEVLVLFLAVFALAAATVWRARATAPRWVLPAALLPALGCGAAAALAAAALSAELGLVVLLAVAGALFGAALAIALVLWLSMATPSTSLVDRALQARDRRKRRPPHADDRGEPEPPAGVDRDRHLFRTMVVAGMPGISEIATASQPPFHKSFLRVRIETDHARTAAVVFESYGVDDERAAGVTGEVALAEAGCCGSYLTDTLRIELPPAYPASR